MALRLTHEQWERIQVAVTTHAPNHRAVTLVQQTFDFSMIEANPEKLMGDKVYDSDRLDAKLREGGVKLIAPHRKNRRMRKTQDGRALRRYSPALVCRRFWPWLHWQRRLVVRWDHCTENFLGFVQLASVCILLKQS